MRRIALFALTALIFSPVTLFAGKIELTTYYPAPYGEYRQLQATGADTSNAKIALLAKGSTGTGLVVTNANQVGIGTTSPQASLDVRGNAAVNGDIQVGAADPSYGTTCTPAQGGSVRYHTYSSAPGVMEYCDGTSYVQMGGRPNVYAAISSAAKTINSGSSWTDVTDMAITVTPSSSKSKLLINANVVAVNGNAAGVCNVGLFKESTVGTITSITTLAAPYAARDGSEWDASPAGITFVDQATASDCSSRTYKVKVKGDYCFINECDGCQNDTTPRYPGTSTMTVLDIPS